MRSLIALSLLALACGRETDAHDPCEATLSLTTRSSEGAFDLTRYSASLDSCRPYLETESGGLAVRLIIVTEPSAGHLASVDAGDGRHDDLSAEDFPLADGTTTYARDFDHGVWALPWNEFEAITATVAIPAGESVPRRVLARLMARDR